MQAHETVEISGHLMDTGILARVLDDVLEYGGDYRIESLDLGRMHEDESSALVEADKGMFDKLLFWQKPQPPGVVVDPEKEAQRLREASALGKPADEGKVPVIERKERGWLEGLF